MALTKVQTIGIETGISLTGVTTVTTLNASTDTLSVGGTVNFGGNVSIAGTLTYEDVTNIDAVGLITARKGIKVDDLGVQVGTGATVDSAADNVLTFLTNGSERARIDSSGNFGIGTASPSSKLNLSGGAENVLLETTNSSGDAFFGIRNGSYGLLGTGDAYIYRSGGDIAFIADGASDVIKFATGGNSERLRIDSSGRLLLGTTTEGQASADDFTVSGSGDSGITIRSGSSSEGSIMFSDATSGTGEYVGWINYNHGSNFMRFFTNATERLRITSAGVIQCGTSSVLKAEINNSVSGHQFISQCSDNNNGFEIYQQHGSNTTRNNFAVYGNTGSSGAKELQFLVRGDGKTGVGDVSPNSNLHVKGGSESTDNLLLTLQSDGVANDGSLSTGLRLINSTSDSSIHGGEIRVIRSSASAAALTFSTYNGTSIAEAVRIDDSGNMGLGTASPSQKLHVAGNVQIGAATGSALIKTGKGATENRYAYIDFIGDTTYSDYGLRLIRNNSGANTTSVLVHRGTGGLQINAQDAGNIQFLTSNTERARLTSSGSFGLGVSSPTKKLHVSGEAFITGNTFFHSTDSSAILAGTAIGKYFQTDGNLISGKTTTNGNTHQAFCNPNGIVGTIRTSGSATQYNTSSDYRLKENVVDITDGITRVKQLQPRRFNFITDADTIVDGFIAHEAQTVVPEAVSGTHNEVDDDGNAVMQGIDASKLVPLLTAALQEEIAKREALEARIAALEG